MAATTRPDDTAAQAQAQAQAPPPVLRTTRRDIGRMASPQQLTVLSYNVLADCYVSGLSPEEYSERYSDIEPSALLWQNRFSMLLAEIVEAACDVVCLQEIMFSAFPHFAAGLADHGYEGVMQDDKKRAATHQTGNCVFFKADRLRLEGPPVVRSRSILVHLTGVNALQGRSLGLANCHLQGDPRLSDMRLMQLKSAASNLIKMGAAAFCVCGDFNCTQDSATAQFLSGRVVRAGAREAGTLLTDRDLESALTMRSAYAGETDLFTYHAPVFQGLIDQIWCCGLATRVRLLPCDDERYNTVLLQGLPNVFCPSDHLPVAAVLDFVPLPQSHAQRGQANGNAEHKQASPAELAEWQDILATAPPRPKGRPTAEAMERLRAHAQRKKDFLRPLPLGTQLWLKAHAKHNPVPRPAAANKAAEAQPAEPQAAGDQDSVKAGTQ